MQSASLSEKNVCYVSWELGIFLGSLFWPQPLPLIPK